MDEHNGVMRKRLNNREDKVDSEASSSNNRPKPQVQDDKVYEGIRGHERHILFHFFTLFSISFFIGVLFIHLSLWMNANFFNASLDGHLNEELNTGVPSSVQSNPSSQRNDDSKVVVSLISGSFHYTGQYFQNQTLNATMNRLFAAPT